MTTATHAVFLYEVPLAQRPTVLRMRKAWVEGGRNMMLQQSLHAESLV